LITIRDLSSLQDYADCVALQDATWGDSFSERVPGAILRVSQRIGGVAAGAFDEQGRMIGFVFGMTGVRERELVHWSDMLAVRDELRGQGIGERLKQYQRDKVMALGVRSMLWTFDPVQAMNANFNINHLGALPIEYVVDMYGSNTGSALHGAFPTDRFIVRWQLDSPIRRQPTGGAALPVATPENAATLDAARVRVPIPSDFNAIKAASVDDGMRWRLRVRETMRSLLPRGYRVVEFDRSNAAEPSYLLERTA
jgi:chorismate synthase